MIRHNLTKILDELDAELKAVLNYLSQFSNEEMNLKPAPDAWSVAQILQHLILSEEISLNYIKKKIQYHQGDIKKGGAASRLRALLLSTSLKQPFKLTAPEAVSKNLPINSDFEELKKLWLINRAQLRNYLNSIDAAFLDAEIYKHPVAGKMDVWGMLSFFEAHVQRHEKQVRKTIRTVEEIMPQAEEAVEHQSLIMRPVLVKS